MEIYEHNGCAQWESILDAAGDIIVLNRALLGVSIGMYYVLNGKVFWMLLGKLMVYSMGNYNVVNWTLFGCSMGSYVLNRKL